MDCCVRGPPCNTIVVTVLVGCLASASALAIVLEMCLRLERFSPLLPPQGKGRSELMGAYNERLRTTDRLGATCYPPLPPSPLELLSGYAGERLRAAVSCVCLYCGTVRKRWTRQQCVVCFCIARQRVIDSSKAWLDLRIFLKL